MSYKPPRVVIDACCLYPFHLRNVLVQCAVDRLIVAHWTHDIHDEWVRNLIAKTPGLTRERLERTKTAMDAAVSGALITGHHVHIPNINIRDPDDRHVVAAGIEAGASAIVTWNLRDFPSAELARHGLRAVDPDTLMLELYVSVPWILVESLANARRNLTISETTASEFAETLKQQKLTRFAAEMQKHLLDL